MKTVTSSQYRITAAWHERAALVLFLHGYAKEASAAYTLARICRARAARLSR